MHVRETTEKEMQREEQNIKVGIIGNIKVKVCELTDLARAQTIQSATAWILFGGDC